MMTPKEALIKDGTVLVKEGRGRLSREANERCAWLVANKGWNIKGYAIKANTSKSITPSAPMVEKTIVNNEKVIADFTYTYAEELWTAVDSSGKVWGMREVCNNCRVSLVQNHCENPVILGNVKVTIKPRL